MKKYSFKNSMATTLSCKIYENFSLRQVLVSFKTPQNSINSNRKKLVN